MKKNIDYYPHNSSSHNHPKFKMLRSLFASVESGWAAEGRFWALNNIIASSEDCQIDLSKKRNMGVYADELGMSISDFSALIDIFSSEDVELLRRIGDEIYTTDKVQETYSGVLAERERAAEKYEKKKKNDKKEIPTEKTNFSTEKVELSGENLYKRNGSEVKEIERNKKKVKESETVNETSTSETSFSNTNFLETSTSHFNFIKNLFTSHTRIRDPNKESHIKPVLQILERIPEVMTENDIKICITEVFNKLNKESGVRMDILIENINRSVGALHEEILEKNKKPTLKEAEILRNTQKKQDAERNREYKREKILEYKLFYEKNSGKFSEAEKHELIKCFQAGNLLGAGTIIEPKIEAELVT